MDFPDCQIKTNKPKIPNKNDSQLTWGRDVKFSPVYIFYLTCIFFSELVKMKCPHCSSMFVNRYNLKVHIRDMHDSPEVSPICDICNKQMRNISCLRMHLFNHKKQAQKRDESNVSKSESNDGTHPSQ